MGRKLMLNFVPFPDEFNRVKLQRQASGSKKDYINASLLLVCDFLCDIFKQNKSKVELTFFVRKSYLTAVNC